MSDRVRFYAVQLADDSSRAYSQLTASFPGTLIRPDGTETPALVIYVMTPERTRAGVFVVVDAVEDDVLHGMIKTRLGTHACLRFKFSAACSAGTGTYDLTTKVPRGGWGTSGYKKREVARSALRATLAPLLDAHPYMIDAPRRRPLSRQPSPPAKKRATETQTMRTQQELDLDQPKQTPTTPVTAYVARVSFVSTSFVNSTALNALGKLHCERGHVVDALLVRYDTLHDAMALAITTHPPTTSVRAFSGYRGNYGKALLKHQPNKHECVTRTQWYPVVLEKFEAGEGARWYQLRHAKDALIKLLQEAQAWPLVPYDAPTSLVSRRAEVETAERRRQLALDQLCSKTSAARPVAPTATPTSTPPVQKPAAARPADAPAFAFCPSCGARVLADARFCVSCGTRTSA